MRVEFSAAQKRHLRELQEIAETSADHTAYWTPSGQARRTARVLARHGYVQIASYHPLTYELTESGRACVL